MFCDHIFMYANTSELLTGTLDCFPDDHHGPSGMKFSKVLEISCWRVSKSNMRCWRIESDWTWPIASMYGTFIYTWWSTSMLNVGKYLPLILWDTLWIPFFDPQKLGWIWTCRHRHRSRDFLVMEQARCGYTEGREDWGDVCTNVTCEILCSYKLHWRSKATHAYSCQLMEISWNICAVVDEKWVVEAHGKHFFSSILPVLFKRVLKLGGSASASSKRWVLMQNSFQVISNASAHSPK